MRKILIKLSISMSFLLVSYARINGAIDPGGVPEERKEQEETAQKEKVENRMLRKWREGPSIFEIDALLERHVEICVKEGYNEVELRRRLYDTKQRLAKSIAAGKSPIDALNIEKSENSSSLFFGHRLVFPLSPEKKPLSKKQRRKCAIL